MPPLLANNLGTVIAVLFGIGLLASGLASTAVGAYAGADVMKGLTRIKISMFWRRAITLIPALLILAFSSNPTWALILSQVVLSFGIPFALIPLVNLTRKKGLLGEDVNRSWTTFLAIASSVFIITINVMLLILTFTGFS